MQEKNETKPDTGKTNLKKIRTIPSLGRLTPIGFGPGACGRL